MASPNITYITPTPGSTIHASYKNGYNTILVRYISDISLNFYEARITKDGDDYDVGVGTLAY